MHLRECIIANFQILGLSNGKWSDLAEALRNQSEGSGRLTWNRTAEGLECHIGTFGDFMLTKEET